MARRSVGAPSLTFGERSQPLRLAKAAISVELQGHLFQVSQTLCFLNDSERTLEGQLSIPLPEGAVVCGFAAEVEPGGGLVDATVVAKEKARASFETEVRDGGPQAMLLEQAAGNVYKARV